jgi:transcriptional regulator with XRE-family HTH domain
MYKEKFSERLKEIIGDESISSVAQKIGLNQSTLSRYIHNDREIGIENLCKIADYFNEDLDILTGRRDY